VARFLGVERENGYLCAGGYGPLAGCVRDGPLWGPRILRGLRRGWVGLRVRPVCVEALLSDVGA
jgi:hypothetical protein